MSRLCRASFLNSPARSPVFLPSTTRLPVCDVPLFQAHQPAPPSSSPPLRESSFVTCHVSKLTNPLLPLPPLQRVSPRLWCTTVVNTPALHSPLLLACPRVLVYEVSRFYPHQHAPHSSSPPPGHSSYMICLG